MVLGTLANGTKNQPTKQLSQFYQHLKNQLVDSNAPFAMNSKNTYAGPPKILFNPEKVRSIGFKFSLDSDSAYSDIDTSILFSQIMPLSLTLIFELI